MAVPVDMGFVDDMKKLGSCSQDPQNPPLTATAYFELWGPVAQNKPTAMRS